MGVNWQEVGTVTGDCSCRPMFQWQQCLSNVNKMHIKPWWHFNCTCHLCNKKA